MVPASEKTNNDQVPSRVSGDNAETVQPSLAVGSVNPETSLKNAATDKILSDAGLAPVAKAAATAIPETWESAKQEFENDPDKGTDQSLPNQIINDVISNPRPLTDREHGILLAELAQRKVRLAKAQQDALADPSDVNSERYEAASAAVRDLIQSAQLAGSECGRS